MMRPLQPLPDSTDQEIAGLVTRISGLLPGTFGYVLIAVPFGKPGDVPLVQMWADTSDITQISRMLHGVIHQIGAGMS